MINLLRNQFEDLFYFFLRSYKWLNKLNNNHRKRQIYQCFLYNSFSPAQFSRSVMSNSLWPHELQHNEASLSISSSWSSLKFTSIELVMPSRHLILCRPLLLMPSIPPSIRVFSNESTLRMRWPKHWNFSFKMSPSSEHPGLISFRKDWLDLLPRDSQVSSPTPQFKSISSLALSFLHSPHLTSIRDPWKNHSLD